MATPEAEETVAAPATVESVVKSVEGGEKEAPKAAAPAEEPPASTEETMTTPSPSPTEAADEATTETAPAAEEPTVPFKEESNLVADLKESEKKALEDFKARIVKAIEANEFKVPKKIAEVSKEPEVVEAPKETEQPAAEATPPTETSAPETPAAETPATETPAAETPATETLAAETPATETLAAETPATETPAAETPATGTPAAETPATEAPAAEAPASGTPAEETPAAPEAAPVVEEKEVVAEPTVKEKEAVVEPAAKEKEAVAQPAVEEKETPSTTEETPVVEEAPAAVETEEAAAPVEEKESAPVDGEAAAAEAVEEEPEDLVPPEDVALWGVPLLHTKGDPRTDVILLKFLRARDFNVPHAFEQLKKTIIWRKTFKTDTLLEEDFSTDLDDVAFYYASDKDGHPVCYNVYAPFQDKLLYAKTFGDPAKRANFLRWRIQVLEKGIIKLLNFSAEGPNSMVQITDMKHFPFPGPGKKEVRSAYNQAVTILQDNYPEMVVKKVFINVPWYFTALFSFFSPLLFSIRTKSKFSVYTPGRTTEALLKFIPGESLPIAYGGLSKRNDSDFEGIEAPATEKSIKASEKATIELEVAESAGTVIWDIAVVGYEVTYAAEYVPTAEGAYTTIIEKPKKLPSNTEEPLRSTFKVSQPGKIVITIDNSTRKRKLVLYRYIVKKDTVETPTTEP